MIKITITEEEMGEKATCKEWKYVSLSPWMILENGKKVRHIFLSDEPMTGEIQSVYKRNDNN